MIDYVIPLVACMKPMWGYSLTVILALAFFVSVPCIIRRFIR